MWGVSRRSRRRWAVLSETRRHRGRGGTVARIFRVNLEKMGEKHTRTSGWCSLTLDSTSSIPVEILVCVIIDDAIEFVGYRLERATHSRSYRRG